LNRFYHLILLMHLLCWTQLCSVMFPNDTKQSKSTHTATSTCHGIFGFRFFHSKVFTVMLQYTSTTRFHRYISYFSLRIDRYSNNETIQFYGQKKDNRITCLNRLDFRLAQTWTSMDLDPANIKTFLTIYPLNISNILFSFN